MARNQGPARGRELFAGAGAAVVGVALAALVIELFDALMRGRGWSWQTWEHGVGLMVWAVVIGGLIIYAYGMPLAVGLERWLASRRGVRLWAYALAGAVGGGVFAWAVTYPLEMSRVLAFGALGSGAAVLGAVVAGAARGRAGWWVWAAAVLMPVGLIAVLTLVTVIAGAARHG